MADSGLPVPEGYISKDESSLAAYLGAVPTVAARLGGTPAEWQTREVGDGNPNLVFIVEGPEGGVVVKQALGDAC